MEKKPDFVVCMPNGPSPFDDNETGTCCDCGREIMFRPYVPKDVPKICVRCIADRMNGGSA